VLQKKDAEDRRVVWSAEAQGIDVDAEGEIDPEFAELYNAAGVSFAPLGIRGEDGSIMAIDAPAAGESAEEVLYAGQSMTVPSRVGNLVSIMFLFVCWAVELNSS
jgi:hypothetical protein